MPPHIPRRFHGTLSFFPAVSPPLLPFLKKNFPPWKSKSEIRPEKDFTAIRIMKPYGTSNSKDDSGERGMENGECIPCLCSYLKCDTPPLLASLYTHKFRKRAWRENGSHRKFGQWYPTRVFPPPSPRFRINYFLLCQRLFKEFRTIERKIFKLVKSSRFLRVVTAVQYA